MTKPEVLCALQDRNNHGGVSFGRFMELALYGHPGYYTQAAAIGGAGGDFFTAAQSPLFAAAVCNAIVRRWEAWGRPLALQVVELGAGQGELAASLGPALAARLPDVRLTYTIVERTRHMEGLQQRRLEGMDKPQHLTYTWRDPSFELATVVVGNEVLDALAVERVRRVGDDWLQAWVVANDAGEATFQWRPASPDVAASAAQWLPIPDGTTGEVCTAYEDFFRQLAQFGRPLCVWLFDYGIEGAEWAAGVRPEGTARGYRQHQVTDLLATPGEQDLTADVDWDHARAAAAVAGLRVSGLYTQGRFLVDHGVVEALSERLEREAVQTGSSRQIALSGALKRLILPGGMGERYQVMQCESVGE